MALPNASADTATEKSPKTNTKKKGPDFRYANHQSKWIPFRATAADDLAVAVDRETHGSNKENKQSHKSHHPDRTNGTTVIASGYHHLLLLQGKFVAAHGTPICPTLNDFIQVSSRWVNPRPSPRSLS